MVIALVLCRKHYYVIYIADEVTSFAAIDFSDTPLNLDHYLSLFEKGFMLLLSNEVSIDFIIEETEEEIELVF